MSDLHLEMHKDMGRRLVEAIDPGDADVLVLAGDILSLKRDYWPKIIFGIFCGKYKHVIYCEGNHEYYGTNPQEALNNLYAVVRTYSNFHHLRLGEELVIDGKRFLGGTLWFPNRPDNIYYRDLINDFSMIEKFVPWVYEQYDKTVANLQKALYPGDVVITHHMPTEQSVHPKYKGDALNRFFFSDLDDLIVTKSPKVWIHGHTHEPFDYTLHNTRIVCNPCGYPSERYGYSNVQPYRPLSIEI